MNWRRPGETLVVCDNAGSTEDGSMVEQDVVFAFVIQF